MPKINVTLVFEDEDLNRFRNTLNLEKVDKLKPHITLYSLEIHEKDKGELKNLAETISKDFLPINVEIQDISLSNHNTLRLLIKTNENLLKLHEKLVKSISKFRDKDAPSKAKKFYGEFSSEEQKLIDQYGRPNVLSKFEPHITLGRYNKELDTCFRKIIQIDRIKVYYDGGNGWIEI